MSFDRGVIAFIGCMLLGVGLGILFGGAAVGTLIGMGVGLLLMFFSKR